MLSLYRFYDIHYRFVAVAAAVCNFYLVRIYPVFFQQTVHHGMPLGLDANIYFIDVFLCGEFLDRVNDYRLVKHPYKLFGYI